MQPRSEPLLWLQCLALGAIPLELLLIRLVLAGADPGPVPGVERFLIWSVGVLAPAVALWRRPADWGSLLLVRQPLASRSSDQLRISASHGALSSRIAVVMAVVILLPVLWWLDDSAVLASEFSPVSGQTRLVTLLLVSPLLALIVWQVQQLIQAAALLFGSTARVAPADSGFPADAVTTQRTSLGLQLLNLPALDWPEPATPPVRPEPAADQSKTNVVEESAEAESSIDAEDTDSTSDQDANADADAAMDEQPRKSEMDESNEDVSTKDQNTYNSSVNVNPEDESSVIVLESPEEADDDGFEDDGEDETDEDGEEAANPEASLDSNVAGAASVPIEPKKPGEEQESTPLDTEVSQIDSVAGGSTEGHREQSESSGGEESEPDQSSEPPPGSL